MDDSTRDKLSTFFLVICGLSCAALLYRTSINPPKPETPKYKYVIHSMLRTFHATSVTEGIWRVAFVEPDGTKVTIVGPYTIETLPEKVEK